MDKFEAMKKMLGGDQEARSFLESLDPNSFKSDNNQYDQMRHSIRQGNDKLFVSFDHPFF
jgi:hypothetical protein